MIGEILVGIFGEAISSRLNASRRIQLAIRLLFGLVGTVLGVIGAIYIGARPGITANTMLRASMVAIFVGLASFSLFNIALARSWRWPGRLFVVSFVALFVFRLLLGP